MKRKFITTLLILSMSTLLVSCGSNKTTEKTSTDSSKTEENAQEEVPEQPTDLSGVWASEENEGSYQEAIITDSTIEINWISDGGKTRSIYWVGSYEAPTEAIDEHSWISERDKEKTDSALLASTDDTKTFSYKNGIISYEVSALGTSTTLNLSQTSNDIPESHSESISSENTASKKEKNDFNSSTNVDVVFAGYNLSIPSTWTNTTESPDLDYYYAEIGDSVVMLQLNRIDSPIATADDFFETEEEFITGFGESFDTFTNKSSEIIKVAGNDALQFSFTGSTSGIEFDGKFTLLIDEANANLVAIGFMQSVNSEYNYWNDYDSILESISYSTEKTPVSKESATTKETSDTTLEQKNALSKAKDYLKLSFFSYTGLIEQLEYEGFSTEDATYAADNCNADWYEQASGKAKDYLDLSPFSYSGLIEQLEFEGFTNDEATKAVDSCGADWNEQAAKCAENYISISSFSRSGLIEQLEFEGFTKEQAEYGVKTVGY